MVNPCRLTYRLPAPPQVNNAGLMLHERTPSADGYETNFAVNTLGTWALTQALAPALHAAPAARVIFVSSGGQVRVGGRGRPAGCLRGERGASKRSRRGVAWCVLSSYLMLC